MVKVKDIKNMKVDEFLRNLSQENKDWIQDYFPYDFWTNLHIMLDAYQEGAVLSGEDVFFTADEYVEYTREMKEDSCND